MILSIKPKRFKLYLANGKYTATQVKALTGADIVINGTLYNMSNWKACMDVKCEGVVLSDETDASLGVDYTGYGWNSNSSVMTLDNQMSRWENFISCVLMLQDGKKTKLYYGSALGGNRQRTAIGFKPNGEMVIYCAQTGATIEKVQDLMLQYGCKDAINLDGGGSTQIATTSYGNLTSSRRVANYICIWEDKGATSTASPTTTIPTKKTCPYIEPTVNIRNGSRGEGAKWTQWHLIQLGYKGANSKVLDLDGIFGYNSVYALKSFQRANKLVVDGISGPATRAKMKSVLT